MRGLLHLSPATLADSKLQSLWRALDEDASGFVSAGEFGRFMRKGESSAPATKVADSKARVRTRFSLGCHHTRGPSPSFGMLVIRTFVRIRRLCVHDSGGPVHGSFEAVHGPYHPHCQFTPPPFPLASLAAAGW